MCDTDFRVLYKLSMKEVNARVTLCLTEEGIERLGWAGEPLLMGLAGSEPRPLGPRSWVLHPHAMWPLAEDLQQPLDTAVCGIRRC